MPDYNYVATDKDGRKFYANSVTEALLEAYKFNDGRLPVTVDLGKTRVLTNREYEVGKTHTARILENK